MSYPIVRFTYKVVRLMQLLLCKEPVPRTKEWHDGHYGICLRKIFILLSSLLKLLLVTLCLCIGDYTCSFMINRLLRFIYLPIH
jgi:hypothetical protein